jgi:hypothetical protein
MNLKLFNNNNNNNNNKVTIPWNQQIQTDRTTPNNKPDIVIRNYENETCMLIDVAIPGDRNVIQKEAEKIFKYKDLTIEIQCMWNNWSNWNHFKIIQTIREHHTRKSRR